MSESATKQMSTYFIFSEMSYVAQGNISVGDKAYLVWFRTDRACSGARDDVFYSFLGVAVAGVGQNACVVQAESLRRLIFSADVDCTLCDRETTVYGQL